MYMLAEILLQVLNLNLQFFVDLVFNNFFWLIVFGLGAVIFYPKKGLIKGIIFIAFILFLFADIRVLFDVLSVFDSIPLTFSLLGVTLFVFLDDTSWKKYLMFFWLFLAVFVGWLLV